MAAYATLTSLRYTLQQIQNHPSPPISLDKRQADSLIEKVAFLQEFLESYPICGGSREDYKRLESRIAGAAYEAEVIIESHVADHLQAAAPESSATHEKREPGFTRCFRGSCDSTSLGGNLYQALEKVIRDMDSITGDAIEIQRDKGIRLERNYLPPAVRPRSSQDAMVGLEDALLEAMDKLTGHQSGRPIIAIVGMGGIGKTTLARNIYSKPLIVQHFDFRAWATISQEFDSKQVLLQLLSCLKSSGSSERLRQMEEHELGHMLYKSLSGRRYLIVMDDLWSTEAWDRTKFFFPDYNNGSRIVITTRLSSLASALSSSYIIEKGFLNEDDSWNLLEKMAFGEQNCPLRLEEIGKQIARNCKGLPLSIVVIGGLLANSDQTQEHWQYIVENLNQIVNREDRESCLDTLLLSYNHLPVHLKPCFLYMGLFPEDHRIRASTLVKLWVAGGFLKPISDKTMEAAGKEYLKDLVQRNLILAHELGCHGNIKHCSIHDVLRDLCKKVAEKEKFFRIAPTSYDTMPYATLIHSLRLDDKIVAPESDYRLWRMFHVFGPLIWKYVYSTEDIFRAVNLRYLAFPQQFIYGFQLPSSFYRLWNLHTLILHTLGQWDSASAELLFNIWRMPRLRHVKFGIFRLPDPQDESIVLWDLQTLQTVCNFDWSRDVVRRIPNIRKLKLRYTSSHDSYGLDNLCCLDKLESLSCSSSSRPINRHGLTLSLPNSLKKLTLEGCNVIWEHLVANVGYLPCLEVLNLAWVSFVGSKLETQDGQFPSLRLLVIEWSNDLESWTMADWAHIPCLDRLVLADLPNLKAIPLEIGDIPTLKSIELKMCSESLIMSAKEIATMQEDLGNEDLRVRVTLYGKNPEVERLASPNFQVVFSEWFNDDDNGYNGINDNEEEKGCSVDKGERNLGEEERRKIVSSLYN